MPAQAAQQRPETNQSLRDESTCTGDSVLRKWANFRKLDPECTSAFGTLLAYGEIYEKHSSIFFQRSKISITLSFIFLVGISIFFLSVCSSSTVKDQLVSLSKLSSFYEQCYCPPLSLPRIENRYSLASPLNNVMVLLMEQSHTHTLYAQWIIEDEGKISTVMDQNILYY